MKTVFTTGEAAKICKVSQQTIIRCFDNGQLKGFRVPGSRFRRIPRESLYKFMKDNGIPTDALESGKRKVLLVDDDTELLELMNKVIEDDGRFEVRIATNGFDAGMMVKEYRPDVIVLDVMLPDINGKEVCHRVRADSTLEEVRILCISGMIEEDKIQELRLAGADDFLSKPFEIEELIDRMCQLMDIESTSTTGARQFQLDDNLWGRTLAIRVLPLIIFYCPLMEYACGSLGRAWKFGNISKPDNENPLAIAQAFFCF